MLSPRTLDPAVIPLEGTLDIAARPELEAVLELAESRSRVTLDLGQVDFMDASALGCLIHLYNRMPRGPNLPEPAIRLVGVRPIVMRLLRLAGFDEIFELCATDPMIAAPGLGRAPRFHGATPWVEHAPAEPHSVAS